jgi:hypothetical protein
MPLDGTYDGLRASVAAYLMRDDLTDVIPDWVKLCESRVARRLRVAEMEATAVLTLASGVATLPADFLEVREILGGAAPQRPLRLLSPAYARNSYAGVPGGPSSAYTIVGSAVRTYPGGSGTVVLCYYAKPTPLSATNPSNWLLLKAPEVYLYGTLLESPAYLADDNRLQVWGTLYNQAIDALQASDTRGRFATAAVRVRGATP